MLIVEDDVDIATVVRYALERNGRYSVRVEHDGAAGLSVAREQLPDLILLDLNLPGMDGMEVCRLIRADPETRDLPIIMLTARVDEGARVAGLELGADDYVSKPFSTKELVARVGAVLRRKTGSEEENLESGELTIDLLARRVYVSRAEVALTRKEFDLLVELVRGRGRVLSRERLLETVWGYHHAGATRTVDVHVRQLRKKLGEPVAKLIETVVGVGYRFQAAPP